MREYPAETTQHENNAGQADPCDHYWAWVSPAGTSRSARICMSCHQPDPQWLNRTVHVDLTDSRSLVVIDPEDSQQVRRLFHAWLNQPLGDGANRLQAALRSLVTDPKPEEPTGLGAVVRDVGGGLFIRTADVDCVRPWSYANNYTDIKWSDINAVRVLSEGVTHD